MITFKEINEKDFNILANIYGAISLDTRPNENWTYETSLSYIQYFYSHQPDLFICAYDDDIPIGAVMSTLKPYYDGMHLIQTEVFVSSDYEEQNIKEKLLEMHLKLASTKYHVSHINAITDNSSLDWFNKIGLEPNSNLIVLQGSLENCLQKIREEL